MMIAITSLNKSVLAQNFVSVRKILVKHATSLAACIYIYIHIYIHAYTYIYFFIQARLVGIFGTRIKLFFELKQSTHKKFSIFFF